VSNVGGRLRRANKSPDKTGPQIMKKHFFPVLIIISCLAFLLRIEVCRELLQKDVQVSRPSAVTDMATYKTMSEQIAKGGFNEEYYYQPFYYAVFLAAIKKVFGLGIWPVMLMQSLLGALTVWLGGICSARLWGRRAGLISAILLAFSGMLIFYTPYHLIATLQAFWVVLIAFLAVETLKRGKLYLWGILGFIVSLGILTRGNIWFFVPGLLLAALFSGLQKVRQPAQLSIDNYPNHSAGQGDSCQSLTEKIPPEGGTLTGKFVKAFLAAGFFLLLVILPQLPFALRNTQIKGKLTGPSTAAGAVLALGNTPEAPPGGRDPGTGPGAMEYPQIYYAWGREVAEVGIFQRIWRWFAREPLAFLELQFRKLLLYWSYVEIPNNIAWEHQGIRSPVLRNCGLVSSGLLMVLAWVWFLRYFYRSFSRGFVYVKNRFLHPQAKCLLLFFILAYWLATAAFYILARFRVPSLPLFAIFAGAALDLGIRLTQRRAWGGIARMLVPLLLSLFLVYPAFDIYRYACEAKVMRLVRRDGTRCMLDKGQVIYLDNGPMSFGSWRPIDLSEGQVIVKEFPLREDDITGKKTAKFALPLFWQIPGKAVLKFNGREIELTNEKPGLKQHEFDIDLPPDGKVLIAPLRLDCKLAVIMDGQRNYGRTQADGKTVPVELVCRLILPGTE